LSEALKLLNDDSTAITNGGQFLDDFTYIKPNAKFEEDNPKPHWKNITKEMANE